MTTASVYVVSSGKTTTKKTVDNTHSSVFCIFCIHDVVIHFWHIIQDFFGRRVNMERKHGDFVSYSEAATEKLLVEKVMGSDSFDKTELP